MMNPYFLMTLLYLSLALLVALSNFLGLYGLLDGYAGLRWLRIHLITLGTLTEIGFWLMPALLAARRGHEAPKTDWPTWLALNGGILTLLAGIPLRSGLLITTGGSLVFIAVLLLIRRLARMGASPRLLSPGEGRPFYIMGLGYLLLGIIVGSGLWQSWGVALHIKVPIEVHIHANSWGFMSLMFAGLLVDFYPAFSGRELAWPRSVPALFWLMNLGALGLVLGPWVGSNWFSVPGLLLHMAASILLLANVVKPMIGTRWGPGMAHLVTSYFWFFAPVLVAPLIIAGVPGFPGAGIEQYAPQALIYGWVLQFGYAILPYFFSRLFLPDTEAELGGNWFSLIASHAAGLLFWSGIFLPEFRAGLQGTAYLLWFLSLLPIVLHLWTIVRSALGQEGTEENSGSLAGEAGSTD